MSNLGVLARRAILIGKIFKHKDVRKKLNGIKRCDEVHLI
jgi:hypothetical protein